MKSQKKTQQVRYDIFEQSSQGGSDEWYQSAECCVARTSAET